MLIYIDMDDVLCDFTGARNQALERNPGIKFPQAQYGFFSGLEPIADSIEAVEAMRQDERFDPYILTAPSILNPLCYTEKRVWVEKYFDLEFVSKLIISPNKSLLKGDVLIDDRAMGNGQDQFEGRFIHYGSTAFPDWKAACCDFGILN